MPLARPILLVIILGRPPFALRLDGGHHASVMIDIGALDRLAGSALLLLILREDRGTVLRADIIALAIELCRVVRREEDVEQLVVADLIGIEGDADGFRMPGVAAADLLVRRPCGVAASLAAFDGLHSDDVNEHRLGTPEASACQDCHLFGHQPAPFACKKRK